MTDASIAAFRKASKGYLSSGSAWRSAECLASAAESAAKARSVPLIEELFPSAADGFLEAGRDDLAASTLARGAEALRAAGAKPGKVSTAYDRAVASLAGTGKGLHCREVFRACSRDAIEAGEPSRAARALLAFASEAESDGAPSVAAQARLGAVVVWIAFGEIEKALDVFNESLTAGDFATSAEARAADRLLTGIRRADPEAIRAAVRGEASFGFLDNEVLRLARKLPDAEPAPEELSRRLRAAEAKAFGSLPEAAPGAGGAGSGTELGDDLT